MKLLKGNRNQCGVCKKYFNSVGAFDKHRVFDNPKVHNWATRRCMTSDEMVSSGMFINKAGFWVSSKMPEHRFTRTEGNESNNESGKRNANDGEVVAG
jgi:hypothetical protein